MNHHPALPFKAMLTAFGLASILLLSGCAIGPDYKRPAASVPAHYKAAAFGSWKEGRPLDDLPKGAWWAIFGDTTLNDLQRRTAGARVEQSRAVARIARSELLPTINADPSYTRQRFSPNTVSNFGGVTVNEIRAPLDLSYEVDLWGRVRRGFESARDDSKTDSRWSADRNHAGWWVSARLFNSSTARSIFRRSGERNL